MNWCKKIYWVLKIGFNLFFQNIDKFDNVTVTMCQENCLANPNCVAFVIKNNQNNFPVCLLKYTSENQMKDKSSTLYYLTCCDSEFLRISEYKSTSLKAIRTCNNLQFSWIKGHVINK